MHSNPIANQGPSTSGMESSNNQAALFRTPQLFSTMSPRNGLPPTATSSSTRQAPYTPNVQDQDFDQDFDQSMPDNSNSHAVATNPGRYNPSGANTAPPVEPEHYSAALNVMHSHVPSHYHQRTPAGAGPMYAHSSKYSSEPPNPTVASDAYNTSANPTSGYMTMYSGRNAPGFACSSYYPASSGHSDQQGSTHANTNHHQSSLDNTGAPSNYTNTDNYQFRHAQPIASNEALHYHQPCNNGGTSNVSGSHVHSHNSAYDPNDSGYAPNNSRYAPNDVGYGPNISVGDMNGNSGYGQDVSMANSVYRHDPTTRTTNQYASYDPVPLVTSGAAIKSMNSCHHLQDQTIGRTHYANHQAPSTYSDDPEDGIHPATCSTTRSPQLMPTGSEDVIRRVGNAPSLQSTSSPIPAHQSSMLPCTVAGIVNGVIAEASLMNPKSAPRVIRLGELIKSVEFAAGNPPLLVKCWGFAMQMLFLISNF
jgi:hypothetical protein